MEKVTLNSEIPESVGEFHLDNKEYMQYLYLPIKMGGKGGVCLEQRLWFLRRMIDAALLFENRYLSVSELHKKYVYLTIKQTVIPKGLTQNRPGWHSDGFGTNDVNYVWYDKLPTEFMIGAFEVSTDDAQSMKDFEAIELNANRQIIRNFIDHGDRHPTPADFIQPKPFHLYRLTQNHVHRTVRSDCDQVRMFVKITLSDHVYAQEGNSHNYSIAYHWTLSPRKTERNQPHVQNESNS